MKKLTLLLFALCAPAFAQSNSVFNATTYAYTTQVTQGNSSTGSSSVRAVPTAFALGIPFLPYNLNASITLNRNGADQETVSLSSVASCYPNSLTCTLAGNFAYQHIAGETIQSGTFGLQEAINAAMAAGSGTVLLDASWQGPAGSSLVTAAQGNDNVLIQDNRNPAGPVFYQWNGSAYAVVGNQQTYILDNYLSPADGHNGTDYGYAASQFCAAVGCSTLQAPVSLRTTAGGICKVFTTISLPGPIQFDASSCALVPQSTMASSYVTLSACSTTIGSNAVTCASTAGLAAGMAIGGDLTLGPANYVASVTSGTVFQMALPASRSITAVIQPASSTVVGVDNLQDVAAGQIWNNLYFPANTTVSSIGYGATQSLAMSSTSTGGSAVPLTLTLNPGTVVSGLTLSAIKQTPVILIPEAPNALKKPHGANFDASLSNVIINDPTYSYAQNSFGRSLAGMVGVQIFGYDNYKVLNLSVNGLNGSGLVLGGYVSAVNDNGAVRESDFTHVYVYSSGDRLTGQPAVALMTGLGSNTIGSSSADEINQIGFSDTHIIQADAENLVIGSYLHTGNNGPRLIWFDGDTQFENGITPYYFGNSDTIRVLNGGKTLKFNGGEYAAPGYAKAVVHVDQGSDLSVIGGNLTASGQTSIYNVTITNGSPTVTYVSANTNASTTGFPAAQYLNGVGALLNDGATCAPCTVFLVPTGSVNAGRTQLTLASNYTGSATSATLTFSVGGYFFNLDQAGALSQLTTTANTYATVSSAVATMLGANLTTELFLAGQNAINPPNTVSDYPAGGGIVGALTVDPTSALLGPSKILNFQDWYPNSSGVQTTGSVTYQLFTGTGNNPSQQLYLKCAVCGSDFYNNLQNTASGFAIQQNISSTGSNKALFGVFGSTQGWQFGLNNSALWSIYDNTAGKTAVTVAPSTEVATFTAAPVAPAFDVQTQGAGSNLAFFDDFLSAGNLTFNTIGSPTGASGGQAGTKVDINHAGEFRLVSGTVSGAGEYGSIGTFNQNSLASLQTAPGWVWESAVFPESLPGSTAAAYEIGMATTGNVSPWNTGIGFYLSSTNGTVNDWYCQYGSTLVDSTVAAAAAWTRLTIVQNGTNALWYINGTQVCSVAIGSLPTTAMSLVWNVVSLTTTSSALDVDYATFQRTLSR